MAELLVYGKCVRKSLAILALLSVLELCLYSSAKDLGSIMVGTIYTYISNGKVSATKNLQGRLTTSHKMRQHKADEPNRWDGNGEEVTVI